AACWNADQQSERKCIRSIPLRPRSDRPSCRRAQTTRIHRQMTCRLVLLTALLTGIASGQDAQISGLIQDASESEVPGAELILRNDQTGGRRTVRSSESGLYAFTTLPPGVYRMTVRAAGFETIVREGIELQIGENARLDFTLRIGDVQTTITVTGGPPLVNQEDASVGTVIDRNLIDRMPL